MVYKVIGKESYSKNVLYRFTDEENLDKCFNTLKEQILNSNDYVKGEAFIAINKTYICFDGYYEQGDNIKYENL